MVVAVSQSLKSKIEEEKDDRPAVSMDGKAVLSVTGKMPDSMKNSKSSMII